MPVILSPADYATWLDPIATRPAPLKALLTPGESVCDRPPKTSVLTGRATVQRGRGHGRTDSASSSDVGLRQQDRSGSN
nr:hypothetical protein [Thiocystis violacea]